MTKSNYVDGYVLVVPKKNLKVYRKMALMAGKVWKKHGALDYKECVSDNLKTKFGVSFTKIMKPKPSEVVMFSYVTFKSKKHRNTVNAKVMKEFMAYSQQPGVDNTMPFDMKKMAYGGFKILVDV